MVTVTGYTADRMKAIEDATIVDAEIVAGDLILKRFDDTETNAGPITGNPLLDTLANLNANNPVVASGRLAIATTGDPRLFAVGDGATAWNSLPKYQGRVTTSLTSYTPTFKGTTTDPVLGTGGTIGGRYYKSGAVTHFGLEIKWGSTGRNVGSGNYLIGLPTVSPINAAPPTLGLMPGQAILFDASASLYRVVQMRYYALDPPTLFLVWPSAYPAGTEVVGGHAVPWTWDVNDTIQINGWYFHA